MEIDTHLAAPPAESSSAGITHASEAEAAEERYPIPGASAEYVFRGGRWVWSKDGVEYTVLTKADRGIAEALRESARAAALANRMRAHAEWEARVWREALRRASPLHARMSVKELAERYELPYPGEAEAGHAARA